MGTHRGCPRERPFGQPPHHGRVHLGGGGWDQGRKAVQCARGARHSGHLLCTLRWIAWSQPRHTACEQVYMRPHLAVWPGRAGAGKASGKSSRQTAQTSAAGGGAAGVPGCRAAAAFHTISGRQWAAMASARSIQGDRPGRSLGAVTQSMPCRCNLERAQVDLMAR